MNKLQSLKMLLLLSFISASVLQVKALNFGTNYSTDPGYNFTGTPLIEVIGGQLLMDDLPDNSIQMEWADFQLSSVIDNDRWTMTFKLNVASVGTGAKAVVARFSRSACDGLR